MKHYCTVIMICATLIAHAGLFDKISDISGGLIKVTSTTNAQENTAAKEPDNSRQRSAATPEQLKEMIDEDISTLHTLKSKYNICGPYRLNGEDLDFGRANGRLLGMKDDASRLKFLKKDKAAKGFHSLKMQESAIRKDLAAYLVSEEEKERAKQQAQNDAVKKSTELNEEIKTFLQEAHKRYGQSRIAFDAREDVKEIKHTLKDESGYSYSSVNTFEKVMTELFSLLNDLGRISAHPTNRPDEVDYAQSLLAKAKELDAKCTERFAQLKEEAPKIRLEREARAKAERDEYAASVNAFLADIHARYGADGSVFSESVDFKELKEAAPGAAMQLNADIYNGLLTMVKHISPSDYSTEGRARLEEARASDRQIMSRFTKFKQQLPELRKIKAEREAKQAKAHEEWETLKKTPRRNWSTENKIVEEIFDEKIAPRLSALAGKTKTEVQQAKDAFMESIFQHPEEMRAGAARNAVNEMDRNSSMFGY